MRVYTVFGLPCNETYEVLILSYIFADVKTDIKKKKKNKLLSKFVLNL